LSPVSYCDERVCVARISRKPQDPISTNSSGYMLPLAAARCGNAICYVLPVLWMTSANAGNRLESKTMHMFRPDRQVAAPGTKSAISDCVVFNSCRLYSCQLSSVTYTCITPSQAVTYISQAFHGTVDDSSCSCNFWLSRGGIGVTPPCCQLLYVNSAPIHHLLCYKRWSKNSGR